MIDVWNERYSKEFIYGKKENDFLAENIYSHGKGKILCLAEGQGRNAVYLAKLGYNVTAIDYSEEGLKKAEILAEENGVKITTIKQDLNNLDCPSGAWDGIVSVFAHFTEETRKHVHNQALIGLKKDGFFIMEAYSKDQLKYNTGGPKTKDLLYSFEILFDDFNNALDFKIFQETERNVTEGILHNGKAAVIQMYGIKK